MCQLEVYIEVHICIVLCSVSRIRPSYTPLVSPSPPRTPLARTAQPPPRQGQGHQTRVSTQPTTLHRLNKITGCRIIPVLVLDFWDKRPRDMRRRHVISPGFSGHYQDLEISSLSVHVMQPRRAPLRRKPCSASPFPAEACSLGSTFCGNARTVFPWVASRSRTPAKLQYEPRVDILQHSYDCAQLNTACWPDCLPTETRFLP